MGSIFTFITPEILVEMGLSLTLFVLALFLIRRIILKSYGWNKGGACPRCGMRGSIYRVPRKPVDRLWGKVLFAPIHRYHCKTPSCGWVGLRMSRHEPHDTRPIPVRQVAHRAVVEHEKSR